MKFGAASRVDFLLEHPDRPPCYLEVKNCHLRRGGTLAEFPDCVAARSTKHLRELAAMVAAGYRAVALFVVQRTDCDAFSACADLDPAFAAGLEAAADAGVEVLVYACAMSPRGFAWAGAWPGPARRAASWSAPGDLRPRALLYRRRVEKGERPCKSIASVETAGSSASLKTRRARTCRRPTAPGPRSRCWR